MKLLTKALRAKLPKLYDQEHVKDPLVYCKFFDPTGAMTWYILEFDGDDTFFCYTTGCPFPELGYASLGELETVRGRFGLGIERDIYFTPCNLSEVKK